MKKQLVSLLLALVMCLGLLPATASAAETAPPDWYFLFAILKNVDTDVGDKDGVMTHQTCSMPQEEIDVIQNHARAFEAYMNETGVMRAHVEMVEIDETVTELSHREGSSSLLRAEQAAPLLERRVDLNQYDYVNCILNLNVRTGYASITPAEFENGTGLSCTNYVSWDHFQNVNYRDPDYWVPQLYTHEFLHIMERMSKKWGSTFKLHREKTHYTGEDDWKSYYTDAILNRINEPDVFPDGGTGVNPAAWQYPPHVLRTMTELSVPSGVTGIGEWAFANNTKLTRVTIPGSVATIGGVAFYNCTGLTEVNILPGVTGIGKWAFGKCPALTRVSIPASVTGIGECAFYSTGLTDVYYGGTEAQWKAIQIGGYNEKLTRANIHCNHLLADVRTTDPFAPSIAWALEKGITGGTGGGRFSPGAPCTQAQILTFLWRAKGSPAPDGAAGGDAYYASAVQWAREQGLLDGSFSPAAPCTRAMAVTYLWKLAGSPKAKAASFSDVPASAGYAGAVSWAVEQGVTSGTGAGAFSPDRTCTRGQIVTFLYRALAE